MFPAFFSLQERRKRFVEKLLLETIIDISYKDRYGKLIRIGTASRVGYELGLGVNHLFIDTTSRKFRSSDFIAKSVLTGRHTKICKQDIRRDDLRDLAVFKIDPRIFPSRSYLRIASNKPVPRSLVAIPDARSTPTNFRWGSVIEAVDEDNTPKAAVTLNVATDPGMSGAPCVNIRGQIVTIVSTGKPESRSGVFCAKTFGADGFDIESLVAEAREEFSPPSLWKHLGLH